MLRFIVVIWIFIVCLTLPESNSIAALVNPADISFAVLAGTNTPIERSLTIVNNETHDIFIDTIRSSCSCIVIKKDIADKEAIPPGKNRIVTFTFYPKLLNKGKFVKYIFLRITNASSPVISVTVTGEIR